MNNQQNIEKKMENKKVSPKLYSEISLDELVTYCVFAVQEERKEATFENVVAECFELFPEKFSLVGYHQWPDSARVNKSWLRCRTDFEYIKGSVKSGFTLTSRGLEIVEKVQKKLNRPVSERTIASRKRASERTREETFIREIEASDVFRRYIKDRDQTEVSYFEFCDLLYGTLETSSEVLNENLGTLIEYSKRLHKKEVSNFLSFIENKFSDILTGRDLEKNEYKGGMNKRRRRK